MSILSAPDNLATFHDIDNTDHAASVAKSETITSRPRRKQKHSEKGKLFLKELKAKNKETAFRNLKKKLKHVQNLCEDPETELEVLEFERCNLDCLKDVFNEAHYEHENLLDSSAEKEEAYHWYDVRDREFTEQRMKLCETIQQLEREVLSQKSSHRSSAKTKRSRDSTSSARSVSQARAEAAEKAAKYKIEMEYLERENEAKRLQLEKKLALAKAEENAYKEFLEGPNKNEIRPDPVKNATETHKQEIGEKQQFQWNPFVPAFMPKNEPPQSPLQNKTTIKNVQSQEQNSGINYALSQLVSLHGWQSK